MQREKLLKTEEKFAKELKTFTDTARKVSLPDIGFAFQVPINLGKKQFTDFSRLFMSQYNHPDESRQRWQRQRRNPKEIYPSSDQPGLCNACQLIGKKHFSHFLPHI